MVVCVKYDHSNRIWIRRTGNRPSPAVAQGRHFFLPALMISPAHVRARQGPGCRLETVFLVGLLIKNLVAHFFFIAGLAGHTLVFAKWHTVLFAYLQNHCPFAMASRLQCETSSKSWKNTRIYLQYSLFYRIVWRRQTCQMTALSV